MLSPQMADNTPLLDSIASPIDLRKLPAEELDSLADEVRRTIIATAAVNGGHLAPHLGVVELTIALHYVYDTPNDLLIWDVGHQCYAHKLLTGRRERFCSVRKKGGLSGYPRPSESEYDAFGVGHSSTSISAALGMTVANDWLGNDRKVVAIIGDGAMTGGMAFEALAHAGHLGKDLLVVLNDNRMAISPNVGALSSYFSRLITAGIYTRAKEDIGSFMKRMLGEHVTRAASRLEQTVKGFLTPGTLFEQLGFRYVGPVDGHDLPTLTECFSNLRKLHGPVFFHVVTQKGKGYSFAEEDPQTYHGVAAFDITTGRFTPNSPPCPTFTEAFSQAALEAFRADSKVAAITAAMPTGTGLSTVAKEFPDRVYDVGICEEHAVTFAAGLAAQGMKPICAIYSTFLQRGFDQALHDVCLQRLPVVFAIDRAGAVGEDSPTQQGAFDLSFLRIIPHLTLLAPRDAQDLQRALAWALEQSGPVAIRYARGLAPRIGPADGRDISRAEILREGTDATFLGVGPCLAACLEAADALAREGISVGVVDARFVKPLDTAMLDRLSGGLIVTVEENTLLGGLGASVLEYYSQEGKFEGSGVRVKTLGFPDRFIDHATREEQLAEIGLDAPSLTRAVRAFVQHHSGHPVA